MVRRSLDFRSTGVPNERGARFRLPSYGFCFALDLLSRRKDKVSRVVAMGICVDFSFDPDAVAHLGAMAFPALFSLCQVRMVWTPARAHG